MSDNTPSGIARTLRELAEKLGILFGDRGSPLDRAVRVRELGNLQESHIKRVAEKQIIPVQGNAQQAQQVANQAVQTANAAAATAQAADQAATQALANQAATVTFRAQQGSSNSLLELIAADNPTGQVSAARITAQNILLKGSVAADFLTVGLGRNLLANTRFRAGLRQWLYNGNTSSGAGAETSHSIRPAGQTWAGTAYPTLMIHQAGIQSAGDVSIQWQDIVDKSGATAPGVPASPDEYFEASVNLSAHDCSGKVQIVWFDKNQQEIGTSAPTSSDTVTNVPSQSDRPDLWNRPWVIAKAPANTAYATLRITKTPTTSPGAESRLFVHKPQLAQSHANAQFAAPYSEQGGTIVGPGFLQTGAIQAGDGVIGNLAVDTIHIANGAITQASKSTTISTIDFRTDNVNQPTKRVLETSIYVNNSPVDIHFHGKLTLWPGNFTGGFPVGTWISLQLFEDKTGGNVRPTSVYGGLARFDFYPSGNVVETVKFLATMQRSYPLNGSYKFFIVPYINVPGYSGPVKTVASLEDASLMIRVQKR